MNFVVIYGSGIIVGIIIGAWLCTKSDFTLHEKTREKYFRDIKRIVDNYEVLEIYASRLNFKGYTVRRDLHDLEDDWNLVVIYADDNKIVRKKAFDNQYISIVFRNEDYPLLDTDNASKEIILPFHYDSTKMEKK